MIRLAAPLRASTSGVAWDVLGLGRGFSLDNLTQSLRASKCGMKLAVLDGNHASLLHGIGSAPVQANRKAVLTAHISDMRAWHSAEET